MPGFIARQAFSMAVKKNEEEEVRRMLADPVTRICVDNYTLEMALGSAVERDYVNMAKIILVHHPDIDLNAAATSFTPLEACCHCGSVGMLRFLISDPRVNVALADSHGRTPLWLAVNRGYLNLVQWMIASGRELGNTVKDFGASYYTRSKPATSWDEKQNILDLLKKFNEDPVGVRHKLCGDLGIADVLSANLFALVIFICEDLLTVNTKKKEREKTAKIIIETVLRPKEEDGGGDLKEDDDDHHRPVRFFVLVSKLPMELQMMVCHRVYKSPKDTIPSHKSEPAFQQLGSALALIQ